MVELIAAKKNKICLSDYNYRKDIENRLLMATFSSLDVAVLEEILFSPLKFSYKKLARTLGVGEEEVLPVLEKLGKTGLLTLEGELVSVDKEMRKYYESEILKFDPAFRPDMEYLQGLLKKVPIHVLPTWYAIPRSSNNIFDSLLEKYLLTPQLFHRYLIELNLGDPTLSAMAQDVFRSPQLCLTSEELIRKYGLSHAQFEEYMLLLEFHFMCCLGYKKEGDTWKEIVTPFQEWKEYLAFVRDTTVKPIEETSKIKRKRSNDYAFIQDVAAVLKDSPSVDVQGEYLHQIKHKITLLKLDQTDEWLEMKQETRALYIYRHPQNKILSTQLPTHLLQERTLREAEKCISRVLYSGWIFFDDFLKGVLVALNENSVIALKKVGKTWRYTFPEYTEEEKAFLKAVVFEWLFEAGITAVGTYEGRDCFCVTPFGQSLFG